MSKKEEIAIKKTKEKSLKSPREEELEKLRSEYNKWKKIARDELKSDLNLEANVSTEAREELIKISAKLAKLKYKIPDKVIDIMLTTICLHPEFASKEKIKFLISNENNKGDIKAVEKIATQLMQSLEDSEFYDQLCAFRRYMTKQCLRDEMLSMRDRGMNNNEIGEKFGFSSAEVAITLGENKIREFDDFDEI